MINITPVSGYILTIPYIQKDSMFTSIKELSGETMKSEVVAVGSELMDDGGFKREAPCKVGDIILHSYLSEDFNLGTIKYRFVHFSNVRGVWKP